MLCSNRIGTIINNVSETKTVRSTINNIKSSEEVENLVIGVSEDGIEFSYE